MHYLLHIDTATDKGTVAVSGDGLLLAHHTNEETRNHAGTINIMINNVLASAQITLRQLSGIAVCAGPGSYTGLRIGVATAKGLCYALDKPLMLHNRLTLLAYYPFMRPGISASHYAALLYARDREYFISSYDSSFRCELAPAHITEDELYKIFEKKENSYIVTDVPENIINTLGIINLQMDTNTQINLESWSLLSFEAIKCNDIVNLTSAEPFYLKQVYTHK